MPTAPSVWPELTLSHARHVAVLAPMGAVVRGKAAVLFRAGTFAGTSDTRRIRSTPTMPVELKMPAVDFIASRVSWVTSSAGFIGGFLLENGRAELRNAPWLSSGI